VALPVVIGAGVFAVAWRNSGAHQVAMNDVKKRFAATSTTGAARAATLEPPAGVYDFRGSGTERLDRPPKTQPQGPAIPATITRQANGCWTFRVDYSTGHWQSWRYCAQGGELREMGGQTYERWDFVMLKVDTTSSFTCSSSVTIRPSMRAGDTWTQTCTGSSTGVKGVTKTTGPITNVGEETLAIGKARVPAYRFHQVRTLSGAQTGTQDSSLWFAQSNGMPLRDTRKNVVKSDSVIGKVTYTETGTFTLASLVPQT
jgi:hypothetical protein